MAKYLFEVSYTAQGAESVYFAFGDADALVIAMTYTAPGR